MKRLLLCLCLAVLASFKCVPDKRVYSFRFFNNSEDNVYVVVDLIPEDEHITIGSEVWYSSASSWRYIDNEKPWREIVNSSLTLYIINASRIDLSCDVRSGGLSVESQVQIIPEMILWEIVLSCQDFRSDNMIDVNYP